MLSAIGRNAGPIYTSAISITLPVPSMLTLYVCMASTIPNLMESDKAMILIQNRDNGVLDEAESTPVLAEHDTSVVLDCSIESALYIVWMKKESTITANVAYSIMWNDFFWNETSDPYMFVNDTSLMIPHVTDKEDGIYFCLFGDGMLEQLKQFNVTAYGNLDTSNTLIAP